MGSGHDLCEKIPKLLLRIFGVAPQVRCRLDGRLIRIAQEFAKLVQSRIPRG